MNSISISFFVFVSMFLGIGIYSATRKSNTSEDYLVASRNIHPWLAALSAVATNNSGFMFIGLIGTTFSEGLSAMWIMIGWVVGDYVAWLLKIPDRLRQRSEENGSVTIPSFLGRGEQGESRAVTALAGFITFAFLGIYAAAQLNAGSKALHSMFGWDYEIGAILGSIVVVVYCFSGGIRASIWTDAAQSIVMFLSMAILLAVGINHLGGIDALVAKLNATEPQFLSPWPKEPQWGAFLFILGWMFAGFGVIGQPHVMVRAMAIDSVDNMPAARRLYVTYNAGFAVIAILVGLVSRAALPGLLQGFTITQFDAELALPTLAMQLLHPTLVGLCLAGLFAATMSTADSQILSCSAVLTQDLFPKAGKKYWMVKGATILVTLATLGIALYAITLEKNGQKSGVFQLVVLAWAALAAGLGPLLLLRCFRVQITATASLSMMLSGILGVLVWRYVLKWNGAIYDVLPGMAAGFGAFACWWLITGRQWQTAAGHKESADT
jgi:sodium/proline symporter